MPPNVERVGILGGSFDPIHNRHIDIAIAAINDTQMNHPYFAIFCRFYLQI